MTVQIEVASDWSECSDPVRIDADARQLQIGFESCGDDDVQELYVTVKADNCIPVVIAVPPGCKPIYAPITKGFADWKPIRGDGNDHTD